MGTVRWATILFPILAWGCAKQDALETGAAATALRDAELAGAEQSPQASLHLWLAKEQLAEAERLSSEGDADRARSMLARAAADAELALLLSREPPEKSEADAALRRASELRGPR